MTRTLWALVGLMACSGMVPAWGAELYVSPMGADTNAGTREKPLATLVAAQRLARDVQGEPVTVYLEGGTYYLSDPIVFTASDSGTVEAPVVYTAVAGQTPVISGGQRLDPSWRAYRDGIMRADVPKGLEFDQLFVDGERQHMARWPDYNPRAQYFQGFSAAATSPRRVARWSDPAGGFLHAMHRNLWGDMHWKITGKEDEETLKMIGGWQNNRQMGAHEKFRFVENIFEELDAPGEWYHDQKQDTLYVFPPAGVDLNKAKLEAVRLKHLVEFRGDQQNPVRHVTLKGLTFTHAARTFMENKEPLLRSDWTTYRGGAIFLDGAEKCQVRDCVVDQVGGNGIFVNAYNRQITIAGCHIAKAGASAISFVGDPDALRSPLFEYHQTQTLEEMDKTPGPKTPNYPANCLVEDCLIYLNGRVEKQTAGVNMCMAESITVRHCSIYDCPRAGINICDGAFGGHLIEFCDVFDTVLETGDHGSFNSWGRDRFWHPNRSQTAAWVAAHPEMPKWDCRQTIVIRNNRWRCDHGWDIDLDDGSSNYEIYNNLCLAGGIKLREGYYRKVYNNVLVNYTFCPHVWYPDCHTSFRHNIIWRDGYAAAGMRTTDQTKRIDDNLVHEPGASARPAKTLRKFGGDEHSIIADAMFVDPLSGDYRVKQGSPALSQGFQNFAMDRFGVQKPALKAHAQTPPLPGTLEAAKISSGGWGRRYSKPKTASWLGARIKELESDGEVSAVGLGDKNGVLVVEVPPGSRADKEGLRENDVLRGFNGQSVKNLRDLADMRETQAQAGPITLELWRDQARCLLKTERHHRRHRSGRRSRP
ncbi:MAG: PDZ domain-containing protein [Pirellulaceae bacterium]